MLSLKVLSIIFIYLSLNVQAISFKYSLDPATDFKQSSEKNSFKTKLRSNYNGTPDYKLFTKLQLGDVIFDAGVTLDSPVSVISYANLTNPGPSTLPAPKDFDARSLESDDYAIYREYLSNAPACKKFPDQCTLIKIKKNSIISLDSNDYASILLNTSKILFALPKPNNDLKISSKSAKKQDGGLPNYDQAIQSSSNLDHSSEKKLDDGLPSYDQVMNEGLPSHDQSKVSSVEGLENIGLDYSNIPSVLGLGGDIIVESTQKHYPGTTESGALRVSISDEVRKKRGVSGSIEIVPSGSYSFGVPTLSFNSEGKRTSGTPQGKFIMAGPIQNYIRSPAQKAIIAGCLLLPTVPMVGFLCDDTRSDTKEYFRPKKMCSTHIYKLDINTSTLKLPSGQYDKFIMKFETTDCKTRKNYYVNIGGRLFKFKLANLMYEDKSNPGKCFMNVVKTQDSFTTLGTDTLAYIDMVFFGDKLFIETEPIPNYFIKPLRLHNSKKISGRR